jgi:nickel/cobalt transporter (NicO) family protein
MKLVAGGRTTSRLAILLLAVATVLVLAGAVDAALAQAGPFGMPRAQGAPPAQFGGVIGWILVKQAEFYRQFSGLIRAAKSDGTAAWTLFGLSFLYGIFHAVGPGHGKAVISSYLVANDETWKRGIVLSFASALVQALVAVVVVGVAAALLNATAATMRGAVNWIETVSYALIILIGLRLFWVKGRAFLQELRRLGRPTAVGAAVTPAHQLAEHHDHHGHAHHHHGHDHAEHGHAHSQHDHAHDDCAHNGHVGHDHNHADHHHGHHAHHGHSHDHDDDASAWGHAHAPEPEELAGPGGWKRGLSAIVAVGLRPCSGAILVLVFALAQGLFWAGVVSTFVMGLGTAITVAAIATIAVGARAWAGRFAHARAGYGMLALRGVEVGAAALIVAFGGLLLTGYMVSERMIGF